VRQQEGMGGRRRASDGLTGSAEIAEVLHDAWALVAETNPRDQNSDNGERRDQNSDNGEHHVPLPMRHERSEWCIQATREGTRRGAKGAGAGGGRSARKACLGDFPRWKSVGSPTASLHRWRCRDGLPAKPESGISRDGNLRLSRHLTASSRRWRHRRAGEAATTRQRAPA